MRQPALLLLGASLAAASAAPLAAQTPGSFEAYVQRMEGTSSPLFVGMSLSRYAGSFGLRLGGALNFRRNDGGETEYITQTVCQSGECQQVAVPVSGSQSSPVKLGGWTADADLILEPLRRFSTARRLLLGFSPYGFAGVGGQSLRSVNGADTTRATWSVGAGVRHSLIGKLGLSAEARYRYPFSSDSEPNTANLRQHMEYRAALTIGFGGRKKATPVAVAVGAPVPHVPPTPTVASSRIVPRVLDEADGLLDAPYRRGGASPDGFDAPGFVQYLYAQQGVTLPRTTLELSQAGTEVSTRISSLRPGDLLLFANDGEHPDHVAIYAGRSRIIHSSASGSGVRYDTIGEGERGEWFADHLVAVRRVVNNNAFSGEAEPDVDPTGQPDRAPPPGGGTR